MLNKERHHYVLQQGRLYNKVLASMPALSIRVSAHAVCSEWMGATGEGKLEKTNGGAPPHPFSRVPAASDIYYQSHQKTIAQQAACRVDKGMFVSAASSLRGSKTRLNTYCFAMMIFRTLTPSLPYTFTKYTPSGGAIIIEMANVLPANSKGFSSGSTAAILEYMNHPNVEMILTGNKFSKSTRITVRPESYRQAPADQSGYLFYRRRYAVH